MRNGRFTWKRLGYAALASLLISGLYWTRMLGAFASLTERPQELEVSWIPDVDTPDTAAKDETKPDEPAKPDEKKKKEKEKKEKLAKAPEPAQVEEKKKEKEAELQIKPPPPPPPQPPPPRPRS